MHSYKNFEFGVVISDIVRPLGKKKYGAKLQFLVDSTSKQWVMREGDRSPVSESWAETKQVAEAKLAEKVHVWIDQQGSR